MKTTGLLSRVHSPVVLLQSSLSSGISRVSSICFVIDSTSSRVELMIEGLGRGLAGFGLLNCICATADIPINKRARRAREAGAVTLWDITLILIPNRIEP